MGAAKVKVVTLLSSWSSGSTSVAGYLDRAGAYTCPPHLGTSDSLTPVAYESLEYRNALVSFIHEPSLRPIGKREDFAAWFRQWLPVQKEKARQAGCRVIALKHPLSIFFLPEIHAASNCKFVFITRAFQAIEQTRMRRKWAPVYGLQGARVLYYTGWHDIVNMGLPYLSIPYEQFRVEPGIRRLLLDYCDLKPTAKQRAAADEWLR